MESEAPNQPGDFLIIESSPQPGDGLDYDRKVAQAASEGKPLVLLFGNAGQFGNEPAVAGLLQSYKNNDAVVCYIDISRCQNQSLRNYLQLIGIEEESEPKSSGGLNGTAEIFTVSRSRSGELVLHSTGSPTYHVGDDCDELNEQLRLIKSLLSPGESEEHLELPPLPSPSDFSPNKAPAPPDLSFAPPAHSTPSTHAGGSAPVTSAMPAAQAQTGSSAQTGLSTQAMPAAIAAPSSELAALPIPQSEPDDPETAEFKRKIDEFGQQYMFQQSTSTNT